MKKELKRYPLAKNKPPEKRIFLKTKTSRLGRVMEVDLSHIHRFKGFFTSPEWHVSTIWQVMADEYINQPYLDIPIFLRWAYNVSADGVTVHHRNHDVTHAVRQVHFSRKILETIIRYGRIGDDLTPDYASLASDIKDNDEISACLSLAIYLMRAGRSNERPGKDDPSNAKRSAELFAVIALELGFDQGLVHFLQFAVATHKPNLDDESVEDLISHLPELPGHDRKELGRLLKGLIDLSHHTDLVRCKVGHPQQPVRHQIEEDLEVFLDPDKVNVERVTTNLLDHATRACKLTGTRVKYQTYGEHTSDNDARLKVRHTQDVHQSFKQLSRIPLDVEQILHEGPIGDFEELLRQAIKSKRLDLSNQYLQAHHMEMLALFFNEVAIEKVSLIGTSPEAMKLKLIALCQQISKAKSTPIELIDIKDESAQLRQINLQFRQQAMMQEKVSMRFEPARMGRAWSQGLWPFIKQLWAEITGNMPRFGGTKQYTQVQVVKKLDSTMASHRYEETVHEVSRSDLTLMDGLQTFETEDVYCQPGEMLLYHGTNSAAVPHIMAKGFDEDRCQYVHGNGYGPLGKGVYFTPELAKAATFASCSSCRSVAQCDCIDEETGLPPYRVVLLCKVFVGKPEIALSKKQHRKKEEPTLGFDSTVSLSSDVHPHSSFRSTEVCVPKGAQVIPLYEIRFISQPNYLNIEEWNKLIKHNGLSTEFAYIIAIDEITELLEEIARLFAISAPYYVITRHIEQAIRTIDNIYLEIESERKDLIAENEAGRFDDLISVYTKQQKDLQHVIRQLISKHEDCLGVSPTYRIQSGGVNLEAYLFPQSWLRRLADIFLPKEFVLKRRCAEMVKTIVSVNEPPPMMLYQLNAWVDNAILRDKHKGQFQLLSGKQTYPIHRVLITQQMMLLKKQLQSLVREIMADEILITKMTQTLRSSLETLDKYTGREPQIQNSTAYQQLSQLLLTCERIEEQTHAKSGLYHLQEVASAKGDTSDKQMLHLMGVRELIKRRHSIASDKAPTQTGRLFQEEQRQEIERQRSLSLSHDRFKHG